MCVLLTPLATTNQRNEEGDVVRATELSMGKCCEGWIERIETNNETFTVSGRQNRIHLSFPGKTSAQFFVHFSKKRITSSLEE